MRNCFVALAFLSLASLAHANENKAWVGADDVQHRLSEEDDIPIFSLVPGATLVSPPAPKSGVTEPVGVSDDYRRGVCDVLDIMNAGRRRVSVLFTLIYDDGVERFACPLR